ncbi:MAG: peptide-methionine (S)-S-oxide reductase MsrA [Bacteroidales bacterium]|nr:peptide-methionine (S)-S-oxide reductase MsrA [Bacteroidales bacterium]
MTTAYFSAGCFWGVEYYFKRLKGVTRTIVGFMGGELQHPSYKQVKTGTTGHLETIKVEYDPEVVSYDALIRYFFEIHDFEQVDGQGVDIGSQYLSAIWVGNLQEQAIAEKVISELTEMGYHVATQIKKVVTFYQAEDYHQNYLDLRQETPECHVYRKIFR